MRELCFALIGLIICVAGPVAHAQNLADRFSAHEQSATVRVDHSAWDGLLQAFVSVRADGVNLVDYARFKAEGHQRLKAYLSSLQSVRVTGLAKDEQFAFWVNLYNALTVDVVLDHYPVASIRDIDISPGFFANGPWGKTLVRVEGVSLSLDDIEHKILRPIWRDPRIHYAVNCASIGCPNLAMKAYVAQDVEAMLSAAARDYVNSSRGVHVVDGEVIASKIYSWYSQDFGRSEAALIAHLRKYALPGLRAQLRGVGEISDYAYDWRLNDGRR